MGTVGISFGSATSGQGFDVTATVTQIQAAEQAIETPWKTQLTALKAQDTAFTSIGTDLSTLTTSLQALTDFTGALAQKQGASSDTNLVQLTGATSTASAGSHTVVVNSIAQTSSNYSDTVKNAADTLSGSITIQVGSSGTPQTVTVGSNSNTLSSLAAAINQAGAGVNASIITDSSGSRLSLVSTTGGAAGQLTITSNLNDASTSTAIGFQTGSTGQDASLSVDGITLTSASNTVTNAIPGVTFQLLAADPKTTVQVQITNDNSAVGTAISSFVTAYNAVIKDINTQEGKDASGNPEPLLGSPVLASIQSGLTSALFAGSASGTINSITQLGLSVNSDGTLSLDTDALQSALTNSYADVTGFLQNSGSFGQSFATTLNGLGTQAPSGSVYLALQQNSSVETNLNQDVTNEDTLLAAQKASLTTELNTANQVLQSIPSQLNQVNEIYSAITGYNNSTNG
jgi:flagellar hook-associated protein 2